MTDNVPPNRKAAKIKLTIFGLSVAIIGTIFAVTYSAFAQLGWKAEFAQGSAMWNDNQPKAKELIEKAILDCEKNKLTVAELMSCHKAYAELLYSTGQRTEGDKEIESAIALVKDDPAPGSEEADQLTHAYQDRGWNAHQAYLHHNTVNTGEADQLKSVEIAEKAFGPDHEQTVYKLPTLALIYADLGQFDKADKIMERVRTACNTKPSAKGCAWFVYGIDSRMLAVEGDYKGASSAFVHAMSLAANDSQRNRIESEFLQGLGNGKNKDRKAFFALVKAEKFAELDKLADELRKSKETYSDGAWRLDRLYLTLEPEDNADNADYSQRFFELKKWLKLYPNSVTARVALSECFIRYAWFARGSAYADGVTSEGWKGFESRIAQAKATLDEDPHIKQKCPRAFRNYGKAALGQGWEKKVYMDMINDCHKTWPTYYNIDNVACYHLLPRWHGDEGDTERFIISRADSTAGVKGDELYAQLVWYIQNYLPNLFQKSSPLEWKRVKSGFYHIFLDFPHDLNSRIAFVKLAMRANDIDSVKSVFDKYSPE